MQKFTIFSILLSITLILVMGDILFHNYLKADKFSALTSGSELEETSDSLIDLQEETPSLLEVEDGVVSAPENEESQVLVLAPELSALEFEIAQFEDVVFKDAQFNGTVFELVDFSDQADAYIYQSNVFEGERFLGKVYEIKYSTEIGSFQGYLKLRERAMGIPTYGEVNETNTSGDASFYFNHAFKKDTVHIVIKKADSIYAFEYPYTAHDKMKSLFAILP